MPKNLMGKTRKVNDPYLTYRASGWEWRVLKTYQADPHKPYARWFCAVKSPHTHDSYDLGDTYCAEILRTATLISPTEKLIAW